MDTKPERFEQLLNEIEEACNGGENPQVPEELKKHLDELKDFEALAEYISTRRKEKDFEVLLKEIEEACNAGENPQIPEELKKHLDELKDFEALAQYISKRRDDLEL